MSNASAYVMSRSSATNRSSSRSTPAPTSSTDGRSSARSSVNDDSTRSNSAYRWRTSKSASSRESVMVTGQPGTADQQRAPSVSGWGQHHAVGYDSEPRFVPTSAPASLRHDQSLRGSAL